MSSTKIVVGFAAFFLYGANAFAQQQSTLAVVNTLGQVWARPVTATTVGAGVELSGPALLGGSNDQFVVGFTNEIAVVTSPGMVWPRAVTLTTVGPGTELAGSLFGGQNTKYVVSDKSCQNIYVINTAGEVWFHSMANLGSGIKLSGPSLFGAPDDKYVVYDDVHQRLLLINQSGQVWAHALSQPPEGLLTECSPTTVGSGTLLTGPGLFGAPNDKYLVFDSFDQQLLVINTAGQVWAHSVSPSSVGPGVLLTGPGLFGGANDKVSYGSIELTNGCN